VLLDHVDIVTAYPEVVHGPTSQARECEDQRHHSPAKDEPCKGEPTTSHACGSLDPEQGDEAADHCGNGTHKKAQESLLQPMMQKGPERAKQHDANESEGTARDGRNRELWWAVSHVISLFMPNVGAHFLARSGCEVRHCVAPYPLG